MFRRIAVLNILLLALATVGSAQSASQKETVPKGNQPAGKTKAWKSHTEPKLSGAGMGYMLQGGGSPSNTDPFATKPPEGKKWLQEPPHLMLFGVKLDPSVYSSDANSGTPWIMWAGTPYEHLMIPVK